MSSKSPVAGSQKRSIYWRTGLWEVVFMLTCEGLMGAPSALTRLQIALAAVAAAVDEEATAVDAVATAVEATEEAEEV